jgi:phage I-like protein
MPGGRHTGGMKLNAAAVRYLHSLIRSGAIERSAPWTFSGADGNALLGTKVPDWNAYGQVHLGVDTSATHETKARFGYPAAKKSGGKTLLYMHGLLGDISRAGQQGEREIEAAARALYSAALKRRRTANNLAALCFALTPGDAAEWLELIPAADAEGIVRGRDGRWWRMPDPQAVADAFDVAIPLDINHASELLAPSGSPSPAQGWIESLEVRTGAVYGHVDWTERGTNAVASRDYRFLSPVFRYQPETKLIMQLASVGLVNEPNFALALNQMGEALDPETTLEDYTVDKTILEALGLNAEAAPPDAVTAINALKTAHGTPALDKFVPRADYDTAINRAQTAETTLSEQAQAVRAAEIDTAINAALEAGKITPPTADYHRAQCAAEGGLERFQEFVKAAPEVGGKTGLDTRSAAAGKTALNEAEKHVAQLFGNSAEDIAKYGKTEEAA